MPDSKEIALKKDLYVQLAFTLFGHIVGRDIHGALSSKGIPFVVSPEGSFFLLSPTTDTLESFMEQEEVLFVVLKEGKSVSDMWDIQVKGKLHAVEMTDTETVNSAKKLFEEKSPYLGTLAFLDLEVEYKLFRLQPTNIFFQNLGQQREGEPSYTLLKI